MNAKWYHLMSEIIDSIPDTVWQNKEAEHMLVLVVDAQIESMREATEGFTTMRAIVEECVGADQPGMLA